ncbi:MAG: hypothetical protein WC847_03005 [Candidatus Paceibacterota bacterium]|jgi:hypothetical protein
MLNEKQPLAPTNIPKDTAPNMELFVKEIAALVEERKNGSKKNMLELLAIENLEELTSEDARIWNLLKFENYKKDSITREDFEKYNLSVNDAKNKSRSSFRAMLANRYNIILGIEQIVEQSSVDSNQKSFSFYLNFLKRELLTLPENSYLYKLAFDAVNNLERKSIND